MSHFFTPSSYSLFNTWQKELEHETSKSRAQLKLKDDRIIYLERQLKLNDTQRTVTPVKYGNNKSRTRNPSPSIQPNRGSSSGPAKSGRFDPTEYVRMREEKRRYSSICCL